VAYAMKPKIAPWSGRGRVARFKRRFDQEEHHPAMNTR